MQESPLRGWLAKESSYTHDQTRKKLISRSRIYPILATLLKLMEFLAPGGVLERFNYAKLPRVAQYDIIKEVLWVAYKDTWRQGDSVPYEKHYRHDIRKTMKFAIKNLLDHLGLSLSSLIRGVSSPMIHRLYIIV